MQARQNEPTVRVLLPLLEEDGSGMSVDQTEQVILNGNVTSIFRGVFVDVRPEIYLQLKTRYPNL